MPTSAVAPPPSLREFRAHLQGLASLTRLRILEFLAGAGEVSVQDLADSLGVSQPRLSWHLRMLRRGHLVRTRRSGRLVLCSVHREGVVTFQSELSGLIAPRPETRALDP